MASESSASLFVYKDGDRVTYVLLYVDEHDIILMASSPSLLYHITTLDFHWQANWVYTTLATKRRYTSTITTIATTCYSYLLLG